MNPIDLPAKEWINEELATLQCERNKGLGEVPFKRELYLGKRVEGIQQILLIEVALSGCGAQPRVGGGEENEGRARPIERERERERESECVCVKLKLGKHVRSDPMGRSSFKVAS